MPITAEETLRLMRGVAEAAGWSVNTDPAPDGSVRLQLVSTPTNTDTSFKDFEISRESSVSKDIYSEMLDLSLFNPDMTAALSGASIEKSSTALLQFVQDVITATLKFRNNLDKSINDE